METSENRPELKSAVKETLPESSNEGVLAITTKEDSAREHKGQTDEHLPFELGQKLKYHRSAPLTVYQIIDYIFVVIAAVLTVRLAWILLKHGFQFSLVILVYLTIFWVLLAYLALPRLHQIMSSLYVPDYYIGRSKTGDGILGDPINLAWLGEEDDIHLAMQAAGWTMADEITLSSSWKIVFASVFKRSYPAAPVSPLYLFGRKQDFAYQQEVDGNPSKRHHVRFWKVPEGWKLPGGIQVDWLAAATFDKAVGLSLFTLQITHKIDENIDIERDHVVDTVREACTSVEVDVIPDATSAYHSRNGGGDRVQTDGSMPVIEANLVSEEHLNPHENLALQHKGYLRSSRDQAEKTNKRRFLRDRRVPATSLACGITLTVLHALELAAVGYILATNPKYADELGFAFYQTRLAGYGFMALALLLAVLIVGTLFHQKWMRLGLLLVLTATVFVRMMESLGIEGASGTPLWITSTTLSVLAILAITSPAARRWVKVE